LLKIQFSVGKPAWPGRRQRLVDRGGAGAVGAAAAMMGGANVAIVFAVSASKTKNPFRSRVRLKRARPRNGSGIETDVRMHLALDTSTADQAHQNHDDGNDQQDVDEAAHGVRRDQAKHPQDQENDCDCI
jgi:hypothetical protein